MGKAMPHFKPRMLPSPTLPCERAHPACSGAVYSPGVCAFPNNIRQRPLQCVNTLTRFKSLHVGGNNFLGFHVS